MNEESIMSPSTTHNWLAKRSTSVALWAMLITSESTAQIAMKLGGDDLTNMKFGLNWLITALTTPAVLVAVGCYAASFLIWMLILRSTHLSVAFPLSSLVFVGVLLGSWLGLGEHISWLHWVGVWIIIGGIALLAEGDNG
jgi:drug/metabolite transporter (DMT)-like permease